MNSTTTDARPLWSADHGRRTLSRRLQRRAVVEYCAIAAAGLQPVVLQLDAELQALDLDRPAPGRTCRLEPTGATFVADRSGRADVPVALHDRIGLRFVPVQGPGI